MFVLERGGRKSAAEQVFLSKPATKCSTLGGRKGSGLKVQSFLAREKRDFGCHSSSCGRRGHTKDREPPKRLLEEGDAKDMATARKGSNQPRQQPQKGKGNDKSTETTRRHGLRSIGARFALFCVVLASSARSYLLTQVPLAAAASLALARIPSSASRFTPGPDHPNASQATQTPARFRPARKPHTQPFGPLCVVGGQGASCVATSPFGSPPSERDSSGEQQKYPGRPPPGPTYVCGRLCWLMLRAS